MRAFELLGLTPDATPDQVRSRWRELAAVHHPDKGGSEERFRTLAAAYEAALVVAQTCARCGGSGKVAVTRGFTALEILCPLCRGAKP